MDCINIVLAGDFCPLDLITHESSGNSFSFLDEVKEYTGVSDYSIVNFESPVVDDNIIPIKKLGPSLKCSENALLAVKTAGFNAVTLANNHFYDYGEAGVQATINACKKYGVEFVGGGLNLEDANKPLMKKIKGRTVAFVNICENEFSIAREKKGGCAPLNPVNNYYQIKQIREKSDYVIVIIHGGTEGYDLPTPRMQDTYRFFIDCGADAVVNHHQHCYSGYEFYRARPIVYGLGNFFFPSLFPGMGKSWFEGYLLKLKLREEKLEIELFPYSQCSEGGGISFFSNRNEFNNRIEKLNEIITDRKQLELAFLDLTKKVRRDLFLEPFQCRIIRSMQIRRWLPSFVNNYKLLTAFDYVNCESHLDILKGNLYERIDK